jgi:alpha-amylase
MLKTNIILGTYNHLPEGLDDVEFERIYQTCYRPFLSALNRFPEIQATLFYSGSLLRRFESLHPEYLMLLEEMSARRQIELLGGGFFAPILPLIPNSDRLGQIELMTTYMRKSFGKRPRGCWLAEYAWEPWLASTLQTSGMDYTFLSEAQFIDALGNPNAVTKPVISEDIGRCVTVFPVYDCSTSFSDSPGFVEAAERTSQRSLTVLMMPGESIRALWEASGSESPDLYMERTFGWFRKMTLQMETTTPSRYLKTARVSDRLYFAGSASTRFIESSAIPGNCHSQGCIRRSIVRYQTASALYSRMFYVHLLIGQLRGDKARKKIAIEDLWKAQSGNAFWKSPSGGIDDPRIREVAYGSLIEAELAARQKGAFVPGILKTDIDFDGAKEYVYQGSELNAYVHANGAVLIELDTLKARRNLCDIFIDTHENSKARRSCFIDRLYSLYPPADMSVSPWAGDVGAFSSHVYDEVIPGIEPPSIGFSREGIADLGGSKRSLALSKRYSFHKRTVKVAYELQNRSDSDCTSWFGVELNLSLRPEVIESISGDSTLIEPDQLSAERWISLASVSKLSLKNNSPIKAVSISLTVPCTVRIASISSNHSQGITLLLLWPLELASDASWKAEVLFSIQE